MAALKYFSVYVKIGANEWLDKPARAENERDAIRIVMNRRNWTAGHVTVTSNQTGNYAQVSLLRRDAMTGEYEVVSSPRVFRLNYKP